MPGSSLIGRGDCLVELAKMSTDLRMEFERVAQSLLTANLHLVGKHCAQSHMDTLHGQICKLRENIRHAKATLLAKQADIQVKAVLSQSFSRLSSVVGIVPEGIGVD